MICLSSHINLIFRLLPKLCVSIVFLFFFFQLFLGGSRKDATLMVYYLLLVPRHKLIKDKHCFIPQTKPSKAESWWPSGFKHMAGNHNNLA